MAHSTCAAKNDVCIASGPGSDMFESTAIIADRLFQKAWVIFFFANTFLKAKSKI